MIELKHFNPLNHLFGRIFIGFWCLIMMLLGLFAWLLITFNDDGVQSPLSDKQQQKLLTTATLVKQTLNVTSSSIEQQLLIIARSERINIVLVNLDSEQISYSMRVRERPAPQYLIALANQKSPVAMTIRPHLFMGPKIITMEQQAYALIIGRRNQTSLLDRTIDNYPAVLVLAPFILSGLLCLLLAWALSRPLRQLRNAVQKIQAGDLSVQVDVSDNLNDEISQLGREFNFMSTQVAAAMTSQRQLLADISHELRTPLARLNLAIGLAHREHADHQLQLNRIEKEAALIDHMIAQVLQLSRLETRQLAIQGQAISIAELMTPIIDDAQYEAAATNKHLSYHCDESFYLVVDINLISSAIENIIRNGIKYCSSEVLVEIKLNSAEQVDIVIEDDGSGLEPQELSLIFDAFFRSQRHSNRRVDGFGLGLAIASRAVQLHKGDIDAKNRPCKGLKITITLPLTGDNSSVID